MSAHTRVVVDDGSGDSECDAAHEHVFKKPAPVPLRQKPRKRKAPTLDADEDDELLEQQIEEEIMDDDDDDDDDDGDDGDEDLCKEGDDDDGDDDALHGPWSPPRAPAAASSAATRAPPAAHAASIEALVSVTNIVFMSRLYHTDDKAKAVKLNLHFLLRRLARYGFRENPKKFKSIIIKLQSPSCSVTLFEEGKVKCPGTRNIDDARRAIERVLDFVRHTRASYATLRCGRLGIQNIVGLVGYPNFIDTRLLLKNEPDASHNPLNNGVRISMRVATLLRAHSASAADIEAAERRNTKVAVLFYQSGRVVITGGKKRTTLAMALSYVMRRVHAYFMGSAERTFSHEDIRRYCSTIRSALRAYEGTDTHIDRRTTLKRKLSEFFVARTDGTVGLMSEWFAQLQPHRALHGLLGKIGETYVVPAQYALDDAAAPPRLAWPAAAPSSSSSSLVVATRTHAPGALAVATTHPHESALVVARDEKQMAVLNERGSMRTSVVRALHGRRMADSALARQEQAALVAEHGAEAVREAMKPKRIKIIERHVAADLFSGFE